MTQPLLLARVEAPEPVGTVLLVSNGAALVALDYGVPEGRLWRFVQDRFGPEVKVTEADDPQGFASALKAYFTGRFDALVDLPVDAGGTPFQRQVWTELRRIPPGETRSYGQLAVNLGKPGASRAVGLANGSNPVNLVVPCHRVIGANGSLTGYGGGLDRKRWLLAFERGTPLGATVRAAATARERLGDGTLDLFRE